MASKVMMHHSTLSSESKQAIATGNLKVMSTQLRKLQLLYMKGMTASNKGTLHRHVIAMKQALSQHIKLFTEHMKQLTESLTRAKNSTMDNTNFQEEFVFPDPSPVKNEWESLSRRHMSHRKRVRFNTSKKVTAHNALEEIIYRHYYLKLTKMTKIRESLNKPSYASRAIARSKGIPLVYDSSYKERFRNLLYKVMAAWKPRDFIQRIIGSKKMHSLCINVIHYIKVCTSPGIDTITNMDIIDNLFRILRRFKISSPVFRVKHTYRGGGPRKCHKRDKSEPNDFGTQDTIGKQELSVKYMNTLSAILRGQFNLDYGLINVRKLYRASKMTGPISLKLKGYRLQPVPIGSSTVQIHYCDSHYVTSEQSEIGIVVWDSIQTTDQFKQALYPQLQLIYDRLSQYQYSDLPDGLVTYKVDNRNMQKDSTSCGIFAVMRAFFILSNTSSKINTDIARSYLSGVVDKHEFTDYDLFSSKCTASKMQVMIENYLSDQKKQQSRKVKEGTSNSNKTKKQVTSKATRKRGRPQKRKYSEIEKDPGLDSLVTETFDASVVKKRGRPAKLSLEEKTERIKASKRKYKLKGRSSDRPLKRGRPSQFSHEEKILKNRETSLRYYHKLTNENTMETVQKHRDKHKQDLKVLRSSVIYKAQEHQKDRERHEQMRENPAFKDKERDKDRESHKDMRKNPEFRDRERHKEREAHREMRENPAFREKERERDRESHRDMREHPAFRKEERNKDRESHRDMRKNPTFREEERYKDRVSHRDMRGNPAFRDNERDKDRESHRVMRKNLEFRDRERHKERELHRDMRENSEFREKEKDKDRISHRDMRGNPAFRDKERHKDKERHQQNRADPNHRREENLKAVRRKYGENLQDAIRKFTTAIQTGPSVVCTCCLQLWFPDNCTPLEKITFPNPLRVTECTTGTQFDGKEWLCSTCTRHLKEDRIPPISFANGMKFYDIPEELVLVQMEERCIALRQPFFQIKELPNGGQRSIKGNVVNVPMDVAKTINALPRDLTETETIGIKFKKKISYKKCDYSENIRPQAVIRAAKYLIANSELYQAHSVKINETWQEKIASSTNESIKTLMGVKDNANDSAKGSSISDIIEIDLTLSDDDDDDVIPIHPHSDVSGGICKVHDAEGDTTEVTIKYEKMNNCPSTSQIDSSALHNEEASQNLSTENQNSDDENDNFSEIDEMENYSGNLDTLLDSPIVLSAQAMNMVQQQRGDVTENLENAGSSSGGARMTDADALVIAPGEGQHPISLFNDPDAEYLAFPSIYCGRRRPIDTECKTKKKPSKADIYKWECRAQDRRVATCIPDLFFKYKSLQTDAVENVVGISMRKVKGKKQPTAGELRTPEGRDKLINQNEGYSLFQRMRNTPPYYSHKKKNLLAVVRQEGMPSLFFTQSCADTKWPELLKVLGKLIDNKDYSDEEVENMSPTERYRLVAADPVTVVRYFENKCHKFQQHIMNLRGSSRRFLRREFQNRGSPHSHEIHWIAGAPIYDPDNPENDKNVTEFIDTWISTKTEVSPDEEKYLKYQIHKHSNSCRKRGEAICRFGIPFFPMERTSILKPLDSDEVDAEKLETLKNAYQELRKKLNDMGNGSEITHEEFLQHIQMDESEYILTIRSSLKTAKVFYQRKPNALRVNPYMKGMLSVIKANHDVQYPLDIYALVCYVADYLLKSQRGLSATLEQAVRDALDGDMTVKQQIRHIGYNLIGAIETSAPEAAYYIMQIPFTYCSVEVEFIPTSPPEDRLYVLKSEQELSELPEGSRDVLKSNKIAKYARRPRILENMCLADYVSELNIQYDKVDKQGHDFEQGDHDSDERDEDIPDSERTIDFSAEGIFPFTVGSATYKKRKMRRVIRFVNYNRLRDEENYCREKLLLYKPWRKEELLIGNHDSYRKAFDEDEGVIRQNMIKYEEFSEEVQEAEELIENAANEDFDELAPTTEQEERDAELIGPTDSTDYRFFRPPKQGDAEQSAADVLYEAGVSGTTDITIETMSRFLSEDKYLNMVRSLNEKQFQIYTHVMHHVSKGNPNPLRIFITGGAGVGKSMVLRCIYQGLLRLTAKKEGENAEDMRIIVAAPTGKASYYAQGTTIHSILKLLPNRNNKDYTPLSKEQRAALRLKFKNLHTIIIDEISMVGTRMFRDINLRLQEIKQNKSLFGGLNVIIFGDLYQLSPIMDDWVFEPPKKPKNKKAKLYSADALAPSVWMENFTCFELSQVMRQKDDQPFCELLNRLREGNQTNHDISTIKDNCELPQNVNLAEYINLPHFYYKNHDRNIHNQKVVSAKEGKCVSVQAIDFCTQTNLPEKDRKRILDNVSKLTELHLMGQLERVLDLKRGLQYDITINIDTEDGLFNGTSVILQHMLYLDNQCPNVPSILLVKPEDDQIGRKMRRKYRNLLPANTPKTWIPILTVHSQFMYSQKHPITRQQFPLTLSAARTFHKAQGCSLDKAVMAFPDFRKAGLHYVGLSRVTKMSGISILPGQFNGDKIHVSEPVQKEMLRLRSEAKLNLCYTPLSQIAANFIIASFNAQSLHKHIEDVKSDWNVKVASVLGICETRLRKGEDLGMYQMANYEFYHVEKPVSTQRQYHGVALYVRKEFACQEKFSMCSDSFECIALDIHAPFTDSEIQIIMCYKQPRMPNQMLFAELQAIMEQIDSSKPFIIMGDFNINKQQHSSLIGKMSQVLKSRQIVSDVTTKSNTCIDLIFTNINPTECGSIFTAVSHHHLTYAAFNNMKD